LLFTVPFGLVTSTVPLVAPAGTVVLIKESETTVNASARTAEAGWRCDVTGSP